MSSQSPPAAAGGTTETQATERPNSTVSGKWSLFPVSLTAFHRRITGRNGEFDQYHVQVQQQYLDRESGEKRFSTNLRPEHIPSAIALLTMYQNEHAIRTVVSDDAADSFPSDGQDVPTDDSF